MGTIVQSFPVTSWGRSGHCADGACDSMPNRRSGFLCTIKSLNMYCLIINIENIHVIMGCDTGFFACPYPSEFAKSLPKSLLWHDGSRGPQGSGMTAPLLKNLILVCHFLRQEL
ncbi:MAG TPA: hypothetical protein PK036_16060, partial [Geobacteraceae bacterium]|nr:hypothetical protein [Geobacteraceae bacterium]